MTVIFFAGRGILASLFILAGIDKITDPTTTIATMTDAGLPLPALLIVAVIAVELGGGLAVAVGLGRIAQVAAIALILHTLAVNVALHPFWAVAPDIARTELSLFFKNIAVIGGLMMVAAGAHTSAKS
ncbi:DoxX family protein [uncultured Tateyamaria sp.]|uniref:DoxX family protein n=1 Tax=uncultured Tateyamaria sp. TaxID=455651 RepID=UPI00260ADB2E|nr:DoxX family protein [uncultured Tateyamaria sp.]